MEHARSAAVVAEGVFGPEHGVNYIVPLLTATRFGTACSSLRTASRVVRPYLNVKDAMHAESRSVRRRRIESHYQFFDEGYPGAAQPPSSSKQYWCLQGQALYHYCGDTGAGPSSSVPLMTPWRE